MSNRHYVIFHHSFDKIAGTERVIFNLLELLSTYPDTRITLLLAGNPRGLALSIDHLSVDVKYLNVDIVPGNLIQLIVSHNALYKSLNNCLKGWEKKISYVCLATNPFLAVLMHLAAKRSKLQVAVVSCEHFSLSVSGKLSLIARKLFYRHLYVVTLTERDRDVIAKKYGPLKCVNIPNASPFAVTPYKDSPREKWILSIGRLTAQKGFDLLISAYSLIANKYPEWKVVIIGDDYGDKNMLQEMIQNLGLQDNISILPPTNNIFVYYKSAGFYVLSSRFEGLPMVLIEAMSFGLPLVAFDCPTGPAELVNSENGILVENGNIEKLAQSMAKIIDSSDLLLKKAVGAETCAAEFDKTKINKLWKTFLGSIQ